MRLRRSEKFADVVASKLSEALGFHEDGPFEYELDLCRAFAFSSTTADEFAEWYLRSECLSKYSGAELPTAEAAAMQSFADGEKQCAAMNAKLLHGLNLSRLSYESLLTACRLVEKVLTGLTLDEILMRSGFGPGSTAGRSRRLSSYHEKWEPRVEVSQHYVTEAVIPYLSVFKRRIARDLAIPSRFIICPGNTVTTVAKNWKTRRVIAREPSWNMFFQKGLGGAIRTRLQKVGLLHHDAQDKQRQRARQSSVDGSLATIDLKNASNTISCGLVDLLVEGPARRVIYDLRSPGLWTGAETRRGRENPRKWGSVPYEMISSMGNGFTFELETLLFWSITAGVCSRKGHHWSTTTVFGDDIICPVDCVEDVFEVLEDVGLTVNRQKSFWEGPFRESCGGHYWNGKDVTPFYLRDAPVDVDDLINLHNRVYSWCNTRGWYSFHELEDVVQLCRRETPKALRGPYGLEGCLWSEWDQCVPEWNADTQSYRIKVAVRETKRVKVFRFDGALLNRLWSSHEGHDGTFTPLPLEGGRLISDIVERQRQLASFLREPDASLIEKNRFAYKTRALGRLRVQDIAVDRNMWSMPTTQVSG